MPAHWFRIAYAGNAFRRSLDTPLGSLSLAEAARAMLAFSAEYRPQHAESDLLECSWGPVGDRFELVLSRRMQRHDHPEATLSLVFSYALTLSRRLAGRVAVETLRDITGSAGYRAVARATVLERRLD